MERDTEQVGGGGVGRGRQGGVGRREVNGKGHRTSGGRRGGKRGRRGGKRGRRGGKREDTYFTAVPQYRHISFSGHAN